MRKTAFLYIYIYIYIYIYKVSHCCKCLKVEIFLSFEFGMVLPSASCKGVIIICCKSSVNLLGNLLSDEIEFSNSRCTQI